MTASTRSFIPDQRFTAVASEEIPAHRFIRPAATQGMSLADAGEVAIGVSVDAVASGAAGIYAHSGGAIVEASGAIGIGDRVVADSDGKAKSYVDPTTDPTETTDQTVVVPTPLAVAMSAATADGNKIHIKLLI